MVEESVIYPTIIRLASCLCTEIQNSELPEPCYCGPIVGDIVYDFCSDCSTGKCGGQAWVRLVDAFPSSDFPSPMSSPMNCNAPIAYTLEVGIVRCKPVGTNSAVAGYKPPTMQQNVDALALQLADLAAMRRAMQCCLDEGDLTYYISNYVPSSPDGDCLGGAFTVTIWGV